MRRGKGAAFGAVVMAIALFTAACGSGSKTNTASGCGADSGQALTGAGSTFIQPMMQKWAATYNTKCGVQVNYQGVGSGAGIAQITAKTVDFGASDAPMKDEDLAKVSGPILHIPMVFGAVVVTYNLPTVLTPLKLTSDTIAKIFLGTITKWNDPAIAADNPGVTLPATAIAVAHRSDGSGTTNIFTSYLDKTNAQWHAKVGKGKTVEWPVGVGGAGNPGVAAAVKQTPGGVGYVELAYAKQNNLPAAQVKNSSGAFVTPDLASTTAAAGTVQAPDDLRFSVVDSPGANAYPICGATWVLVYKNQTDQKKGKALVDFLWWATHDGQADTSSLLYASLPQSLVSKVETKIRSIDFNGTPLYTG